MQLVNRRLSTALCLLVALLLAGCQTPPQTRQLLDKPPAVPRQHLIAGVPFYPQQDYFCGPTTLAEVAGFYGKPQDPAAIAPQTFIPELQGSLQIEMAAATRQLGLLAYAQRGSMQQLLSLVADNMPVIVLQNNSISWWPQWHYAVVIGYNLADETLTLHTGVTPNYQLDFATFERTWQRGAYWLLLMLPADKTSPQLDPFLYTKAAQDLLSTQQHQSGSASEIAGVSALQSATAQWPDYWLPYFLLGNHYNDNQPAMAMHWFGKGLGAARQQIAYLNNYALLLSAQGCPDVATALLDEALRLAPQNANLLDSQQQIRQNAGTAKAGVNKSHSQANSQAVQCPAITSVNNLTNHQ
ncbi:PA2778 family cysteine peptidase [Rheinheimera texasensis]|uniref:PA2778 family cysteine peptidase n=1 Tax=Rheinheimera texasensis TaxID=306205 RepID=UPI0032B2CF05